MRLTAYSFDNVNDELLQDLGKIYTPAQLQRICERLQEPNAKLQTAMFNGKHLAAMLWIEQGELVMLYGLAVREVTQRRGVGRFLVDYAVDHSKTVGAKICQFSWPGEMTDTLRQFATKLGFIELNDTWTKSI